MRPARSLPASTPRLAGHRQSASCHWRAPSLAARAHSAQSPSPNQAGASPSCRCWATSLCPSSWQTAGGSPASTRCAGGRVLRGAALGRCWQREGGASAAAAGAGPGRSTRTARRHIQQACPWPPCPTRSSSCWWWRRSRRCPAPPRPTTACCCRRALCPGAGPCLVARSSGWRSIAGRGPALPQPAACPACPASMAARPQVLGALGLASSAVISYGLALVVRVSPWWDPQV